MTSAEHETFEQLIAQAAGGKLPVDGNGHLMRRLGNKLLRAAFAPPGDPHVSYLVKDENPFKKGRTKEFGYVCTCWRGAAEVCRGCARKRKEEQDLRKRRWEPSERVAAMMERSEEINRREDERLEKELADLMLEVQWKARRLGRRDNIYRQRDRVAGALEGELELEEVDLVTN